LLNPALKGKIAFADPQKSSTSFNHIINMLYALSDAEDTNFTKGWQYINSFVQNIDGKLLGSSSLVFKSVIDGEFAVGLSYEPVVLRFSDGNPNISVVYADEGVIAPAEGVYVVKNAPHSENAQKFVDFMTSLSVQEMLENQLYTRGVRSDLVNTALTPIGTLNIITTNDDNVNSQSESYLMHFKDIFASLN
jgi:iron(III) transport system substrate-binding protein